MTLGAADPVNANAPNLSAVALTLSQSCVELMADYGVRVTPQKRWSASAPPSAPLIAGAEFGGASLRGSVVLSATRGVILETALGASPRQTSATRNLPDWSRELVNQLLGRMKNKLRKQDVSVDVGLPTPLTSADALEPACDVHQSFSSAAGTFSVFLTVLFEPDFVLGECSVDQGSPSEGELLLF